MSMDLSEFFFDVPLYTPVDIIEEGAIEFLEMVFGYRNSHFDGYNPKHDIHSTFEVVPLNRNSKSAFFFENGGVQKITVRCRRKDSQFHYLLKYVSKKRQLIKIGQYPSVADFHINEIKKYSKILTKSKLGEITRAIGLAANGIGIGSYVYLRRIFESQIKEAKETAISESAISEEQFFQAKTMDLKIKLLGDYLPIFLVENSGMYGILSLGIHELDEETCLAHFDILRVGIELILDERLEEYKKQKKIEDAKKKIAHLQSNLKNK